jgi:hypothetical protein
MNSIQIMNKGRRRRGNVGEIKGKEMNSSNHKTSPDDTIS